MECISCKYFVQPKYFVAKYFANLVAKLGGWNQHLTVWWGWLQGNNNIHKCVLRGFLVLTSPCRLALGDGLKKLFKTEISLLKRMFSFSRIYCFSSGDTSSPNSAWLSCQIWRFTSTAHALYKSLSAITNFSFFSGTCDQQSSYLSVENLTWLTVQAIGKRLQRTSKSPSQAVW